MPEPKDFVIVGETAAEQEAWHRSIADVIDALKNPKDKTPGLASNNAGQEEQLPDGTGSPSPADAALREASQPVTISSDPNSESNGVGTNNAGASTGENAGTSLPNSAALISHSPPAISAVANGQQTSSSDIPPIPAPASGAFRATTGQNNDSQANAEPHASGTSHSGSANDHTDHDQQSNQQLTSSGAIASNSSIANRSNPPSPGGGSSSLLSSSPARKGMLEDRIPAIAALEENTSPSPIPSGPQDAKTGSSNASSPFLAVGATSPVSAGVRSPNAHLQVQSNFAGRRPSLSNLLVPVPKASGMLDIPHMNAEDIEGQLLLLADDLRFISDALSWREAPPMFNLQAFELSSSKSLHSSASSDSSSVQVHAGEDETKIVPPSSHPNGTSSDSLPNNASQDHSSTANQDVSSPSEDVQPQISISASVDDSSNSEESKLTSSANNNNVAAAASAFSELHLQSTPALEDSGALSRSGESSMMASSSSSDVHAPRLEAVHTVTTTGQQDDEILPEIPTVDPKTAHPPRASMRWASPRSSLTQQLFLALDASEADREAILDDIIDGIDDATSATLIGHRMGGNDVDTYYNDAETTADLLAALMDPEHSNYTASPSSYQPSPLELAMQQNVKLGQHATSSSASSSSTINLGPEDGDQSQALSAATLSGLSSDQNTSLDNKGSDSCNLSSVGSGEGEGGLNSENGEEGNHSAASGSDAKRPPMLRELQRLGVGTGSSGSGSWHRPERRPTAGVSLCSSASSHRTASAAEIHQLEKGEVEARLRRLRDRLISNEDPYEIYDCSERAIGKGGMGEVFFATFKRPGSSSTKKVAIKKLQTFFKGKDRLPTILNEINVMAHSKHPNIINYLASYQVDQELWVCMEYMDKGSLYDLVRLNIKLDEKHMAYIIKQIVYALTFIHDLKRVHRDIKVDNVLMSSRGEIKLADFGAAVQLTFQRLKRTTMMGTPYYMSPEVIGGKQYDELVDVWSLGILCIELAERAPPYYDLPPDQALDRIVKEGVKGLQGRKYSSDFLDFVNNKCLQFNPTDRWTASQLQNHPFLKKAVTQQEFAAHLESLDSMAQVDSGCTIL